MQAVYVYLLLASGFTSDVSWNVTPMPNMEVCSLTLEQVMKGMDGPNYERVSPPSVAKCIEVPKTSVTQFAP